MIILYSKFFLKVLVIVFLNLKKTITKTLLRKKILGNINIERIYNSNNLYGKEQRHSYFNYIRMYRMSF